MRAITPRLENVRIRTKLLLVVAIAFVAFAALAASAWRLSASACSPTASPR